MDVAGAAAAGVDVGGGGGDGGVGLGDVEGHGLGVGCGEREVGRSWEMMWMVDWSGIDCTRGRKDGDVDY